MRKGFTLVELMIAVVIMSIISTPLLHAFVTAARVNGKARDIQNATAIAQTTIENIKAHSLEDISRDFNHYTVDSHGTHVSVGLAMPDSFEAYEEDDGEGNKTYKKVEVALSTDLTVDEIKGSSITATTSAGNVVKTVFTQKDEYYFVQNSAVNVESKPFDVLIKATSSNSANVANIMSMNRSDCAYYAESKISYNEMLKEYRMRNETFSSTPVTTKEIESQLSRVITIDFIENESNESVTITTAWSLSNSPEIVFDADKDQQERVTIFNNYVSGEDLKAIYVYYYPIIVDGQCRDRFVINNDTGNKVSVYLISMEESNIEGEAGLFHTGKYRAEVKVNDGNGSGLRMNHALTVICKNSKSPYWTLEYPNVRPEGWENFKNLGNQTDLSTKFDISIDVYLHDEDSWLDNTFTPNNDFYILSMTGSVLDESEIQ